MRAFFSFLWKRKAAAASGMPQAAEILFFGLGNPGRRYFNTRHNIGFRVADALALELGNRVSGSRGEADYTAGTLFESKYSIVVKPLTFMNRSGEAVASYLNEFHCPAEKLFVIVDDYHLPLGILRARRGGSDGGHNGLKSIIGQIGVNFPRLRVGIGPLPAGSPSIDFVLGPFSRTEEQLLQQVIVRAVEACKLFAQSGIEPVMNSYNR
jgi:PTH1 family peptidyl-tRNA hydrolase